MMTLQYARLLSCALLAALMGWTSSAFAAASFDVEFINSPPVTMTAPPAPTPLNLDQTFSVTSGTGHAIIHDGPGRVVLGGLVQANAGTGGAAGLTENLEDVLLFSGLSGPTAITFHLLVDGNVLVPVHGISDLAVFGAFIAPAVTMNITADTVIGPCVSPGCVHVPLDTPTPISLDITGTEMETNGVPQDLVLSMQLGAIQGSLLDFLHSAILVVDLPLGASVTSDGGFAATGAVSSMPEPSSLMILGLATLVLAASLYRRRAM
jgi:hypothetical protein